MRSAKITVLLLLSLLACCKCSQSISKYTNATVFADDDTLFLSSIHNARVDLYTREEGEWVFQDLVSDGLSDNMFGYALAVSDAFVATSAYLEGNGTVYVYDRLSTGFGAHALIHAPEDVFSSGVHHRVAKFGVALSIEGDTLAIGASDVHPDEESYGWLSYFIYSHSTGVWVKTADLIEGTSSSNPQNAIVVKNNAIFYRSSAGTITIASVDGSRLATIGDESGYTACLAATGSWLVVGDSEVDAGNWWHSGETYVYNITDPTNVPLVSTLVPPFPYNSYYGLSVSAYNNTVSVGAHQAWDYVYKTGAAFVYRYNPETADFELAHSTYGASSYDHYGFLVATSDTTLVVIDDTSTGQTITLDYSVCPAGSEATSAGGYEACPAGTFAGALDPACLPCPLGTYQPSVGQSACLAPDDGYYAPPYNRTTQLACPAGFTTHEEGWTCVNASTPFTLDGTDLNEPYVYGLAADAEYIAASVSSNSYQLLLFDAVAGDLLSKTELSSSIGSENEFVAMTDSHIIVTAFVRYSMSSVTILSRDTQPIEIATMYYSYDADKIDRFADVAGFQAPDSTVSTFVLGNPRSNNGDIYGSGMVMLLTVDGTDASSISTTLLNGTSEYEHMGRSVAIDENFIYFTNETGSAINVVACTHALSPVAVLDLDGADIIRTNGEQLLVSSDGSVKAYSTGTLSLLSEITPAFFNIDGHKDSSTSFYPFGESIALCGDRLVVSEPIASGAEAEESGYLYVYHSIGDEWVLDDRIPGTYKESHVGFNSLACTPKLLVASSAKTYRPDRRSNHIDLQTSAMSSCGAGTNGVYPACTPCQPGTFSRFADSICLNASAGFFTNVSNANVMTECAPGYYQPEVGQTSCIAADPGFYVDPSDHSQQLECPPGYFSSDPAAASCTPADPGYYVSPADRTSQVRCTVLGTYSLGGAGGATSCTVVEAGYYATSQFIRGPCHAGKYQDETGQTECKSVTAPDTYTPVSGAWSEPKACPEGFTSTANHQGCVAGHMDFVAGISDVYTFYADAFVNATEGLYAGSFSFSALPTGCTMVSSNKVRCTQPVTSPTFTVTFTAGGESHTTTATLKLFKMTRPTALPLALLVGGADTSLALDLGFDIAPAEPDCPVVYSLSGAPSWATVNETALILAPVGSTPSSSAANLTVTSCAGVASTKHLSLTYLAIDGSSKIAQSPTNSVVFEPINGMAVTNVTIAGQSGTVIIDGNTGEAIYVPIGPTANGTTTMTVTLADGGSTTMEVTVPAIPVEYNVPSEVWLSGHMMTARTLAVNGSCAASLEASYLGETNVTTAVLANGSMYCVATAPTTPTLLRAMEYAVYADGAVMSSGSTEPEKLCIGIPQTASNSNASFDGAPSSLLSFGIKVNSKIFTANSYNHIYSEDGQVCVDINVRYVTSIDSDDTVDVLKSDNILSVDLLYASVSVFHTDFELPGEPSNLEKLITVAVAALAVIVGVVLLVLCLVCCIAPPLCAALILLVAILSVPVLLLASPVIALVLCCMCCCMCCCCIRRLRRKKKARKSKHALVVPDPVIMVPDAIEEQVFLPLPDNLTAPSPGDPLYPAVSDSAESDSESESESAGESDTSDPHSVDRPESAADSPVVPQEPTVEPHPAFEGDSADFNE
ncbi:Prokaryotic membrane lipoprotein lipid attachment site [Carpediemonas membranifera]|uniref:Prokaryotic membrane lipoprotein lipid attachment site n=1 Tax=Carpediemonas membranifera TaxID=201153 RepID=A0A8J6AV39_9EUKA|nr:Prokaryotic membrane lipoprotein lipid attachment site [Carpediemonas membranifera]|eukprot:KAG9392340.1 Prokaryotic membrane lipoprotein lipid attachment site [Carpediemonas membranifera]